MLDLVLQILPRFAARAPEFGLENVLPGMSAAELAALESELGIPLPATYKRLLGCMSGFWLMGGVVQFGPDHLFVHDFPPLEKLAPAQRRVVELKGGDWPPPSQGMLCFAEFWLDSDGDQALFDISGGLIDDEYPIVHYSHNSRPPSVRTLATTFAQFMEEFLDYEAFR